MQRIGLFAELKLQASISLIGQKCALSRIIALELQANLASEDSEMDVAGLGLRDDNDRYGAVLIFFLGCAIGYLLQVPSIHSECAPRMFRGHRKYRSLATSLESGEDAPFYMAFLARNCIILDIASVHLTVLFYGWP